jgi:hypothetical protein
MGGSSGLGGLASLIPGIGPILGPALAVLGMIQGGNQSQEANNLTNQGIAAQQPIVNAENQLGGLASAYDPAAIAQQSGQSAFQNASNMLAQSSQQAAGQFMAGGGSPSGDTAFQTMANRNALNITSPLETQFAQTLNAAPQQKMQALQSVFSAPSGQLGSTYFNAANAKAPAQGSWQSALGLINQGLGLGQAQSSGLSGGSNYGPSSTPSGDLSGIAF